MPSYEKGSTLKMSRERRRWTRFKMIIQHLDLFGKILSDSTISRVETGKQDPSLNMFSGVMESLGLPVETFFYPYLINVPLEVFALRDHLLYYLEWVDEHPHIVEMARDTLAKISSMADFSRGINRQFIVSCQVRLYLAENRDPVEILPVIREAILITYPDYLPDAFEGDCLLFEEPALIYGEAIALARNGEREAAVLQLERIRIGLDKLPQDDKAKEKHLPSVMLELARLLNVAGDYKRTIKVCDEGNDISLRRAKGKHTPDFVYTKAIALAGLKENTKCIELLKPVYFGYIALRKRKAAAEVMEYARASGLVFDTYGVENLPSHMPEAVFGHGKPVKAKSIGDLIYALRNEANLDQEDLCSGVCSISTLSRIETGEVKGQGNFSYLEVFFQRLGRNIDKYFDTFLNHKEFREKQMRDKIAALNAGGKYNEAQELLDELRKSDDYKNGVNLQFILMEEACIYVGLNKPDEEHMLKLKKAWRITNDDFDRFDEHSIAFTRLTNYEIIILNQIAINLCANEDYTRGLRIFEGILASMMHFYVDESERIRMYPTVLYNYSRYLCTAGRYQLSLEMAIKGEELCLKHRQLKLVPSFMANRAVSLFRLGEKEKSIPYLVLAHYTSILLGRANNQAASKKYAKEHFDMDLD